MLVQYRSIADRFYQAVDWDLLAFFGALFVVINVMEHAHVLELIGRGLRPILEMGDTAGPATLLLTSAVASSVTDNIQIHPKPISSLIGPSLPISGACSRWPTRGFIPSGAR